MTVAKIKIDKTKVERKMSEHMQDAVHWAVQGMWKDIMDDLVIDGFSTYAGPYHGNDKIIDGVCWDPEPEIPLLTSGKEETS